MDTEQNELEESPLDMSNRREITDDCRKGSLSRGGRNWTIEGLRNSGETRSGNDKFGCEKE